MNPRECLAVVASYRFRNEPLPDTVALDAAFAKRWGIREPALANFAGKCDTLEALFVADLLEHRVKIQRWLRQWVVRPMYAAEKFPPGALHVLRDAEWYKRALLYALVNSSESLYLKNLLFEGCIPADFIWEEWRYVNGSCMNAVVPPNQALYDLLRRFFNPTAVVLCESVGNGWFDMAEDALRFVHIDSVWEEMTPLVRALIHRNLDGVRWACERNADVNKRVNGVSTMYHAVPFVEGFRYLADRNAFGCPRAACRTLFYKHSEEMDAYFYAQGLFKCL